MRQCETPKGDLRLHELDILEDGQGSRQTNHQGDDQLGTRGKGHVRLPLQSHQVRADRDPAQEYTIPGKAQISAGKPPLFLPLLLALAGLRLLVHLLTNGAFGVFRDEYYYLACAEHLSWGYVDHPPLSIAILAAWKALFGESVQAIRIPVALAASGSVFLAGLLARELGGRRAAQGLAALAVWIMPAMLATSSFHSMNGLEPLLWLGVIILFLRIVRDGRQELWPWVGLLLGLGLLNKFSIFMLGIGLGIGLLATPARRHLARRGPYMAAAIAGVIFVPHVIWQIQNGWPTLEFMSNAKTMKIVPLNPAAFFAEIALEAHPISLLLWLPGLIWLFFQRKLRPLAYLWPAAAMIILIGGGKPYYLAPAHPLILCAGAVALTFFLERRAWRWGLPILTTLLMLGGLFTLPLALPLFSPERTALYLTTTKLQPETGERSHRGQALPQYFADRFAWPEQAAAVAAAYATLDSTEREGCVMICSNYGRAGAIDYFRRRGMDLPPPVCGHNSYFYWWPADRNGEAAISIGQSEEELRTAFESVELFTTLDVPFAMSYEGHVEIWICRKGIVSLEQIRESLRFFI